MDQISVNNIADAFHALLDDLDREYDAGLLSSFYGFNPAVPISMSPVTTYEHGFGSVLNIEKSVENLYKLVAKTREELAVLKLGLSYQKFRKFRRTAPYRDRRFYDEERSGSFRYEFVYMHSGQKTAEDCEFCFNFVIEMALHLQEH